jgi:hypothetical protein
MESSQQGADDWVLPIVRQYFQTAGSGFPYIDCPDELRPTTATGDIWWVIYAPNYAGGIIVEGYLIEQWRERQRIFLAVWFALGILLFYLCMYWGSWLIAAIALISWIGLAVAAGWFARRSMFAGREWVIFPETLITALYGGAAAMETRRASEHRKQALPDALGQVTGKIGGAVVETFAGKAVGQISEIALEKAFKNMAEQLRDK